MVIHTDTERPRWFFTQTQKGPDGYTHRHRKVQVVIHTEDTFLKSSYVMAENMSYELLMQSF